MSRTGVRCRRSPVWDKLQRVVESKRNLQSNLHQPWHCYDHCGNLGPSILTSFCMLSFPFH